MLKSEFIATLRKELLYLNKEECNKFINYYDELLEDYKENGFTEEDAVKRIGNPQSIAENILTEQSIVSTKIPIFKINILTIVLLILGFPLWGSLLLAAFLLVLSAYIVIWCIPFTTGVSSIAFFIIALVSIVGTPFIMNDILAVGVVQLGAGIASIGFSILSAFVTLFLSKKLIYITKKLNSRLLKLFNRSGYKLW